VEEEVDTEERGAKEEQEAEGGPDGVLNEE
jgi:hypothetical protein